MRHWVSTLFFFKFFLTFIYFRDRERAWTGEGQKERETQNLKQAPGSEPSVQSPTRGSNSRTTRWWPGWSRTLNRLCHPGAPVCSLLLRVCFRRLGGSVSWASNFSSGHALTVHWVQPRIGLCADSLEPGACFRFCVSLSLCPSPIHALSVSVPKINKKKKLKKKKEVEFF